MMKIKTLILCLSASIIFTACHRNDFCISGSIVGGFSAGQTIYFEHIGLKSTEILDSVKLGSKGTFKFYQSRPEYPDLFQIRLNNSKFVFPIDSTERIFIVANGSNLMSPQLIEGSGNAVVISKLRESVVRLQTEFDNKNVEQFKEQVQKHRHLADSVIMSNTHSIVAYYAIFQRVGEYYVYNPYVKSDRVYCAAVATGFKAYMPLNKRSQVLESWVLSALQDEKRQNNIRAIQEMVDNADDAFIEIELPDKNGETHKLSDLKGKIVLLDFSAAEMEQNAAYTLELRELYNHYHSRGFEIYQVSADVDVDRWKQATAQLPWVCVHESKNTFSSALVKYNVHSLPTMYILDKQGQVCARHTDFKTIDKDINKLIK